MVFPGFRFSIVLETESEMKPKKKEAIFTNRQKSLKKNLEKTKQKN